LNTLNDHTTDELNKIISETDKMILFVSDFFWMSIKFHKVRAKLFGAWWKYLRRLSVGNKSWMLFMIAMMIRMPEAYAVNVTVKSTSMFSLTTSYHHHEAVVMPTADIVSLMKGKKPISIPENEVVTSEDTEDYLEENSEEDYDDMIRKENSSGECFILLFPQLSPH
jgi:hypothetical protein